MTLTKTPKRSLRHLIKHLGIWPPKRHLLRHAPRFFKDVRAYKKATPPASFEIRVQQMYPIINEYSQQAGDCSGHYFHQDLWAARKIHQTRPKQHVDIGSRLDGFIAHLLAFMDVTYVDVRALKNAPEGLHFVHDDATELKSFKDNSIESISCLHAAEHFGLGRYGDPVDPTACFKLMNSLQRVLKPGGQLYFSVPIGIERVEFNAHRVFDPQTPLKAFSRLQLLSFAAVNDEGSFVPEATPESLTHAHFSCGLYAFTKA